MSVLKTLVIAAACLALAACGGPTHGPAAGAGSATVEASGAALTVTPRLKLQGVDRQLGSVVVEELLLHVSEVRLSGATEASDVASQPMWVHYRRDTGAEVHGVEPVEVAAGDYAVSVTLAPSSHRSRTAGVLHQASIVVRGVCLLFETEDDEPEGSERAFSPGGQRADNPVPMPARPKAKPLGGRVVRVPFSFSSDSVLAVGLGEAVSLRTQGAELAVTLAVDRWMDDAIHPIIAEAASRPGRIEGSPVTLELEEDAADPRMAAIRDALEASIAGSLSAELEGR